MSRSNIFELAKIAAEPTVVELSKTLDDGKPCAIKVRPLTTGDFLALGRPLPIPSGRRSEEWTTEEQNEWYDVIKALIPYVVVSARHVATNANGEFIETWIPLQIVIDRAPDYSRGELSMRELESLGFDTVWRIGGKILVNQDRGGEMETLPATGDDFRMGRGADRSSSLGGEAVADDAARSAVQSS